MKPIFQKRTLELMVLLGVAAWTARDLKAEDCPMHAAHQTGATPGATAAPRLEGVNARGDEAMGFDHSKTTHHFLLRSEGGVIQVEANEPSDTRSRDAVRGHLAHIAGRFSDGDFELPMFIHAEVPPGVPVMKEKRKAITYSYEPTEKGGLVRITTRDAGALAAVHAFLKFQILDHQTGDSAEIPRSR